MRVVLASSNAGKLREMRALLEPCGLQLIPQSALAIEPAAETGRTFRENALIKARHAARRANSAALADDSGIEVDALGGRPGVHSARYAGDVASDADNVGRLLEELRGMPDAERSARFRCCLALVRHADDPEPLIAEGAWEGRIAHAPRGRGGFGYDPVFVPRGLSETAAELAPEAKNAASHRGQALRALRARLEAQPLTKGSDR